MAATLPAKLLARSPAAGEWSAIECLHHLLDVEKMVFPLRVDKFLSGEDLPYIPDEQAGEFDRSRTATDLAAEFDRLRKESLLKVAGLSADDLDRTAHHGELGMVSLSEMLHEWAAHDLVHTVQAERALMQPFIAKCGPWKPGFAEHIA